MGSESREIPEESNRSRRRNSAWLFRNRVFSDNAMEIEVESLSRVSAWTNKSRNCEK